MGSASPVGSALGSKTNILFGLIEKELNFFFFINTFIYLNREAEVT